MATINDYNQVTTASRSLEADYDAAFSSNIIPDHTSIDPTTTVGYTTMVKPKVQRYIPLSSCQSNTAAPDENGSLHSSAEYLDDKELNGRPEEDLHVAYYSTIVYQEGPQSRQLRKLITISVGVSVLLAIFLLLWIFQSQTRPTFCTNLPNPTNCRREFIQTLTQEAFTAYRKYAWGGQSIAPLTKKPSTWNTYPGLSIIAAMSTLHLVGLREEWNLGQKWIEEAFNITELDQQLHSSTVSGDYMGSLLSAYALSGEVIFLNRSREIAKLIEAGIVSKTGMFLSNFYRNSTTPVTDDEINEINLLSYIGFQQPEFIYLATITDDRTILDRLNRIRRQMEAIEKPNGLYMYGVNVREGTWLTTEASLSRTCSLFFYNLLRSIIQGGGRDRKGLVMYSEAIEAAVKVGMLKTFEDGHLYVRNYETRGKIYSKWMQSSACRLAAMLTLGAQVLEQQNDTISKAAAQMHQNLAINLTETCYHTANRTKTGLLPSKFMMAEIHETNGNIRSDLAESYFFLWRSIGDTRYREYAWQLALAYYQHCRAPSGGYSDITDVNTVSTTATLEDYQDVLFLSGTLKYLYLIFTNESELQLLLPAKEWFFTDRGHPLPVCGLEASQKKKHLCHSPF